MIEIQRTGAEERVCQGDIFIDIDLLEKVTQTGDSLEISKVTFPHVVVLTQDCDLEQDARSKADASALNKDKWLLSVLVAPMFNAEHVYEGKHLSELGRTSQQIPRARTQGNHLRTNQNPRYHFLEFPHEINIVPSVVDFKNYFSVTIDYLVSLKQTHYVCSLATLYREDLSQRFASFLSRIGLPEQN